jgi:hypothetical protein
MTTVCQPEPGKAVDAAVRDVSVCKGEQAPQLRPLIGAEAVAKPWLGSVVLGCGLCDIRAEPMVVDVCGRLRIQPVGSCRTLNGRDRPEAVVRNTVTEGIEDDIVERK